MTSTFPPFEHFYRAVNRGRDPFPWQVRLANEVAGTGWPEAVGIPTGLGKTTCLDIAVWALANQAAADGQTRSLPTRIWYVVNRRLLVDAAYRHGLVLAALLHQPSLILGAEVEGSHTAPDEPSLADLAWAGATDADSAAIQQVARALTSARGFGGQNDSPLTVTRLRGGAELGVRPAHPAQPAIIFATVPMFGSSWLFRGYASSPAMRPIDAAHAGIDSLVLLDEAHLSRALRNLADPVRQCDPGDPSSVLPPPRSTPTFVSLSATGDSAHPFELDSDDLAHPVVQQRLGANKPVRLAPVKRKAKDLGPDLVKALRDELEHRSEPCAAVVFANTPDRARTVFDLIKHDARTKGSPLAGTRLCLLTGRMRQREADAARRLVLDPVDGAPADRDPSLGRPAHLVVIATQTLEVGADLDFDVLVTETCGRRALIQRLGRLNRLGKSHRASGVIVHPSSETDWGLYGTEPAELWDSWAHAIQDGDGMLDLSPGSVGNVIGIPDDQPQRTGELLPAHLWEWVKTTTPPPGEAPVELFFEGLGTEGPRVSVCWRATRFEGGDRLIPSVSVDEAVDLPLSQARRDLEASLGPNGMLMRLARDRVTVEVTTVAQLRPNDVVILDVSAGLYDDHGWSPTGSAPVLDVSLDRWPGMPLDPASIRHWASPGVDLNAIIATCQLLADDPDVDQRDVAVTLIDQFATLICRPELEQAWADLLAALEPVIEWSGSLAFLRRRPTAHHRRQSALVAADAFDDLSADSTAIDLRAHSTSVEQIAQRIAEATGLPPELTAACTLAGHLHDAGKADPRFQRWLDPAGRSTTTLAKSSTARSRWRSDREASGWPSGGRHEALSARLVLRWFEEQPGNGNLDEDLVTHLVLSHHGYGRPLIAPVPDEWATTCTWEIQGCSVTVSGDLSTADWDQPARFRACCERYGYWGVALMEAIVRQADHIASSAGRPIEVA